MNREIQPCPITYNPENGLDALKASVIGRTGKDSKTQKRKANKVNHKPFRK